MFWKKKDIGKYFKVYFLFFTIKLSFSPQTGNIPSLSIKMYTSLCVKYSKHSSNVILQEGLQHVPIVMVSKEY